MTIAVLEVLRARAAAGGLPGHRDDGHVVSLVIEGGGMRGAVSAGMCAVLEEAGLVPSFDRIYGCSAGALTGCFAAAGQASQWAATVEDAASRRFINPMRAVRRRPVMDLGYLFETVIGERTPLSWDGGADRPEIRAVAVSVEDARLRVLAGFADRADLLAAVRVSCAVPVLGGPPARFRGEAMVDGGLVEPVPFRTALREGSTHVLVLRTRDEHWRARRSPLAEHAVRRAHPQLARLVAEAPATYNRDAEHLQAAGREAAVRQVAVGPEHRLVGRLSTNPDRVAASLRLGASAMAAALYGAPARVLWRPVVYLPSDATAAA